MCKISVPISEVLVCLHCWIQEAQSIQIKWKPKQKSFYRPLLFLFVNVMSIFWYFFGIFWYFNVINIEEVLVNNGDDSIPDVQYCTYMCSLIGINFQVVSFLAFPMVAVCFQNTYANTTWVFDDDKENENAKRMERWKIAKSSTWHTLHKHYGTLTNALLDFHCFQNLAFANLPKC